jgi:hypothetical protein
MVNLTDGTDSLNIDDITEALPIIKDFDNKINLGNAYEVSHLFEDVATGSDAILHVGLYSTDSNLYADLDVAASGKSHYKFYENSSVGTDGTLLTSYNKNRTSANTSGGVFYHSSEIGTDGDLLASGLIPGAVSVNLKREVLKLGNNYIMKITNDSGTDADISINMNYYEA